jgi:hypothetical protein
MSMTIDISSAHYYRLLMQSEPPSREYAIMRNDFLVKEPGDGNFLKTVVFRCELAEARLILDLARRLCPEAVPEIAKAIVLAREQ